MSKLDNLITEFCPEGVSYIPLGEVCDIYKGVQFNKVDMNETGSYPVINGGINPSGYIERFNENENTIELEYILSCDMNCSICSTLDSQKNPLKDITSMTCEELDSAINNSAGKKTVKLTYENNRIIENLLTSEKLIDDTTGYSNNIKSKLLDFYKTKCSNE